MSLKQDLNGAEWEVKPFPPGCFETYGVDPNGRVNLKTQTRYYEIGVSKPVFKTLVPWEGDAFLLSNYSPK